MDTTVDPRVEEERQTAELAARMGLAYADLRATPPEPAAAALVPDGAPQRLGFIPLRAGGGRLEVGVPIETEPEGFDAIRRELGEQNQLHFSLISQSALREALPPTPIEGDGARRPGEAAVLPSDFRALESALEAANPKDLFTILIRAAAAALASDAHIEPGEAGARIRFRIDGVLHPVARLSSKRYKSLLADLQIRSGMKWGLGEAQGGRLRVELPAEGGEHRDLDIRIETVPALHGEDIVMRLFHLESQFLELERLGMNPKVFPEVEELLTKPHGMVLTVGPTGSGKTSTLYALMNRLNSVERKMVTLEDPVEYEMEGVTQIPVDTTKTDFAEMLRAVLREDPDVVMIGEIRDSDTAKTALQASLTGHLMLSSFHGIDTAAAITRLLDLSGEHVLITSALRLVIAQRLVRRICPDCRTGYEPSAPLRKMVEETLASLPEGFTHPEVKLFRGQGCPTCHYFGYQGRIGIFEVLTLSPALRELVEAQAPADKLREVSRREGLLTLEQDGIMKALEGHTTVEEVFRVVGQ